MTGLAEFIDVIGQQSNLSGLQNWAKAGGMKADPDLSQLAQMAPRTYAEMAPAIIQRQQQMGLLGLNGQQGSSSQSTPQSQSALAQYGSSGDSDPNAPAPQSLPDMSQPAPQQQGQPQGQQPASGLDQIRQAFALGNGNLEQGFKAMQAQRALSIPPGVTLEPGTEFSNGQVTAIPGAAQAKATQQQQSKTAETTGTNLAEAQKTLSVMKANLPSFLERITEMKKAAIGDPQNNIPPASYGFGVGEEGDGVVVDYHNQLRDPVSSANAILRQRAAQGVLPELGPQLAQAGIRGNKFLEQLANSASGLRLNDSPEAKSAAIDGLQAQYMRNLNATEQQVNQLSGGKVQAQSPSTSTTNAPNPALLQALQKRGLLKQ
jgi:uncharacterized coiled-coil protein SlyX